MGKDLSKYQDTLRCGTCRNLLTQSSKVNVNKFADDFVFVNCDDCQKRYEEHNQLTASFVICTCDKEPKELPLEMAGSEIKAKEKWNPKVNDDVDPDTEMKEEANWDNAFKSKIK